MVAISRILNTSIQIMIQVGAQTSQVKMSPVGKFSWMSFSEETNSLDDNSFTKNGLVEQISMTWDRTDYLWYTTSWVANSLHSWLSLAVSYIKITNLQKLIPHFFLFAALTLAEMRIFWRMARTLFLLWCLQVMLCMFSSMDRRLVSSFGLWIIIFENMPNIRRGSNNSLKFHVWQELSMVV